MLQLNAFRITRNRQILVSLHEQHCLKSTKSVLKNEYQKTLNLPNPGEFGLSMKNICKTENKIKKVYN